MHGPASERDNAVRKAAKAIVSRLCRAETGFTLLELLVAVAILGFIGVGLVQGLGTVSRSTRIIDEKAIAGELITGYLEAIKDTAYAGAYPQAGQHVTVPPQYSVTMYLVFSNDGTAWSDTYSGQTLEKMTISVSREGRPVLSVCTFRTQR